MCVRKNSDSGGPLFIKVGSDFEGAHWVVSGITSFGNRHCGSRRPTVYTRVTSYISWIKEKMM